MTIKSDIQDAIDAQQADIDALIIQRDALSTDRTDILAGIPGKELLVSEALLDGDDGAEESADLEADKVKVTDLDAALVLADGRLTEYSYTLQNLKRSLVDVDYESLVDQADALLIDCLSQFQATVDANISLREKLTEVNQLYPAATQGAGHLEHRDFLSGVNEYLGVSSKSIIDKLARIESSYPNQLAAIRSKLE